MADDIKTTDIDDTNTDENTTDSTETVEEVTEADESMEEFVEDLDDEIEDVVEDSDEDEVDETEESENNEDEEDEEEDSDKETETKGDGTGSISTSSLLVFNDDVPPSAKWYVVHTYSGHEKKVAQLIKEFVFGRAFQDKIFKILVPTQQKIVVSEGKKRKVNERLFPGYIIVNMIMSDEAWYLVRSTKGVTGFVGHGDTPTPLPQKEVDALVKFMSMDAPKFEAKFREGDSVKITDGPFQDFLGKVDEVNEDQGKVRVLVSVFGRETPVELDFIQVTSL